MTTHVAGLREGRFSWTDSVHHCSFHCGSVFECFMRRWLISMKTSVMKSGAPLASSLASAFFGAVSIAQAVEAPVVCLYMALLASTDSNL